MTVVDALPVLKVRHAVLSDTALSLLEGESATIELEIEARGTQPIDNLEISIEEDKPPAPGETEVYRPPPKLFNIDQSIVQSLLPLAIGTKAKISVTVCGLCVAETSGAQLNFDYSSRLSLAFRRRESLRLSLSVIQGLQVVHFAVLPADEFVDEKSTNLSVKGDGNWCMLVLEVINTTSVMFELCYEVNGGLEDTELPTRGETIALRSNCGRRVVIPLRRFDVSEEELANVKFGNEIGQFVVPEHPLTPTQERAARLACCVENELMKRVCIRWHSVSNSIDLI